VEGLPNLRAIGFEKRAGPLRYYRFLRALRARHDVVIDAAHWHALSLTSALLSRWAPRRWVVGTHRGPSRLVYAGIAPLPDPGTPDVLAKLRLGAPLGLRLSPAPMETALGREPSPVAGRYAALNPGARKQDHRWPPAGFASFARKLQGAHGLESVVFWGPGEEAIAGEVVAAAGGSARLAPPTNLDQLAAAFRAAALVVTNDTGPMHLAVACGAAVIGVFLDDAGLRWAHPGPRFEAVVAPAAGRVSAPRADLVLAAAYAKALRELKDSLGLAGEPTVQDLAAMEGVISLGEAVPDAEAAASALRRAVDGAIEALDVMRRREG